MWRARLVIMPLGASAGLHIPVDCCDEGVRRAPQGHLTDTPHYYMQTSVFCWKSPFDDLAHENPRIERKGLRCADRIFLKSRVVGIDKEVVLNWHDAAGHAQCRAAGFF